MMYNQIFFTNVLRLLDEQSMTKHDLAEKAGMSISFLSDLTNGKGNPSLKIMGLIADALNVPLPTLLEMTDLDKATLDFLAGGKAPQSLPDGFKRISAILNDYQAYTVQQWDEINQKLLARKNQKKS